VLLHEARNDRDAPPLARFMVWLGSSATIGANLACGSGYLGRAHPVAACRTRNPPHAGITGLNVRVTTSHHANDNDTPLADL
jgi:hypothetical protein